MITPALKKLRRRFEISSEEERVMRESVSEVRPVKAGKVIIHAGEELNSTLLLLDGWLARSKDLAGGERQVTQLHVPGDFGPAQLYPEAARPRRGERQRLPTRD